MWRWGTHVFIVYHAGCFEPLQWFQKQFRIPRCVFVNDQGQKNSPKDKKENKRKNESKIKQRLHTSWRWQTAAYALNACPNKITGKPKKCQKSILELSRLLWSKKKSSYLIFKNLEPIFSKRKKNYIVVFICINFLSCIEAIFIFLAFFFLFM